MILIRFNINLHQFSECDEGNRRELIYISCKSWPSHGNSQCSHLKTCHTETKLHVDVQMSKCRVETNCHKEKQTIIICPSALALTPFLNLLVCIILGFCTVFVAFSDLFIGAILGTKRSASIVGSALQALVNPQIFAPMACQASPPRQIMAICR